MMYGNSTLVVLLWHEYACRGEWKRWSNFVCSQFTSSIHRRAPNMLNMFSCCSILGRGSSSAAMNAAALAHWKIPAVAQEERILAKTPITITNLSLGNCFSRWLSNSFEKWCFNLSLTDFLAAWELARARHLCQCPAAELSSGLSCFVILSVDGDIWFDVKSCNYCGFGNS